jgi:hypothetical protein
MDCDSIVGALGRARLLEHLYTCLVESPYCTSQYQVNSQLSRLNNTQSTRIINCLLGHALHRASRQWACRFVGFVPIYDELHDYMINGSITKQMMR